MKTKENSLKNPVIKIDKSLNKYSNVVLFPESLARANEMLKKTGLPDVKKQDADSKMV